MSHQKNSSRGDAWVGTLSWVGALLWWSCQSPVALSCGLLNHPNRLRWGMFKLTAKFGADSLLYSLSHFECNGHPVHMLTRWCLPPPLTGTVKALFTHAHSRPLSLAATLHGCCANHSCYINNGWTFFRQTSYIVDISPLWDMLFANILFQISCFIPCLFKCQFPFPST